MIRPARAADYAALQDIERRAGERFREIGLPHIADHDPYSDDELAAAEAVLVALDDTGAPAGYAMVGLVDGHAHLAQLSVVPEHGGHGIGTALLDAVVGWAQDRGDSQVTLTTFRDVSFNAPFYAQRGFAELPERDWTPAIRDLIADEATDGLDPATRIVMRRSLR